ncbi:MAG TPA: DNA alkylation repair protein [Nitrospirae bacterium]|nr:DNA alkylation repair protein [Nitrospirota bacterium]
MDKSEALKSFRKSLRAAHDPERARQEKRYLKSPFKFFGVKVPQLRLFAKNFKRANPGISREQVFDLASALWESEYHQEKSLAIMVLEQYPQYLDSEAIPSIEHMIGGCNGWDHADWISINLMGRILEKDPVAIRHLVRWSGAWSLWQRRASMTAQIRLFRTGGGDRDLFFKIARGMVREKEFFIRKAIGWVVREISKANPDAARDFLIVIREKASGLTIREGAKRLPAQMKEEVLGKHQ